VYRSYWEAGRGAAVSPESQWEWRAKREWRLVFVGVGALPQCRWKTSLRRFLNLRAHVMQDRVRAVPQRQMQQRRRSPPFDNCAAKVRHLANRDFAVRQGKEGRR